MKFKKLIIVFLAVFWSGCGLLSTDHEFDRSIPISEINGSFQTDSIVVCKILKENNISLDSFSVVTSLSPTGRVTRIFLNNRNISTITDSIYLLYPLISLNLDSNNLTTLPDEICQLQYLKILHLSNNQFTSLPENFGDLKKLDYLNLNNNFLTSLPESIKEINYIGYIYEHESKGGSYLEYNPKLFIDSNYISGVSEELKEWLYKHDPLWESKQRK